MSPNPYIMYIDLVSVLACGVAIVLLVRGWKRPGFLPAVPTLLLALLLLNAFYYVALFLEWSGFETRLDWVEDIAGVFIPFTWAFAFYAIIKNAVEADLKASGEHFRNLVESTGDWIWEVDAAGRYTYASPHVTSILGYTPEEIIGKTPFDLMAPEEVERVSAIFGQIVENQEPFEGLENTNLHKDGREVVLETNGNPAFDSDGKLIGYRGVDRDITRRLENERLQKKQQAEMDSVFRASPAGIGLVRNGYLIRGNERFFEITGYPKDELVGADPRRFYLTDQDYFDVGQKYAEARENGFARIETRFVRKDQAVIDVVIYIAPLDKGQADAGFVIVLQDITAFKAARQEAIDEKTRAQIYLDLVNVMILVLDAEGRIKLINKKGCELLECSIEKVAGVDWFRRFVPGSYRDISRSAFQRILVGDEEAVAYFESPVHTGDGIEKLIAWRNTALRDDAGKIIGVISSGEDITEARAAEEAMRESDERLRVAMSAAAMGVWRWNAFTNQLTRDASLNALLGEISAETVGGPDTFFCFVHPEDRDLVRQEFERAIRDRDTYLARYRIQQTDGPIRWVLDQGKPFYDFNGRLECLTGVMVDITELKQAEEQIRQSKDSLKQEIERFEYMFHMIPDALYMKDLDSRLTHVNQAYLKLVGATDEQDLIGKTDFDFFTEEHARPAFEDEQEIMRTGIPKAGYEEKETWPDGRITWCQSTKMPLRDADGNVIGLIGMSHDITEPKRADQALRDSEEKYRTIFYSGNQGFFLMTDVFLDCNDRVCEIWGCSRDDVIGHSPVEFSPEFQPDGRTSAEAAKEYIDAALAGQPQRFYWQHIHKNGELIDAEITLDLLKLNDQSLLQATMSDISERVKSEQQLKKSEQQNRAWLENSPVCTKILDLDFNLQYMSQAGIDGLKIEDITEFYGKPYPFDFFPESFKETMVKNLEKARETGEIVKGEAPVVDTEGNEIWYHATIVPVYDENDQIDYIIVVSTDTTERKRAERQLQFTQFAVDHAGEAAYWMGPDAKFIYVNESACQSLGYTRDELLSLAVHDVDPDFPAEAWSDHWNDVKQQESMRFESHHKTKDGRIFPVEITTNYVKYNGNEYNCAFARDITERKVAEQKREVLIQQIQNRNNELQSIVFTAAHDLRSPLVNIDGFTGELEKGLSQLTEALAGASLEAKVAERVEFLLKTDLPESLRFVKFGNQQMDMLLGGLMRLSRVGSSPMKLATLDMNGLFEAVVRGFQYQVKTLNLDIAIQDGLPTCTGDYSLLAQVFINLLDNAIKYRHPDRDAVIKFGGCIRDDMAEYTITDNGIGIEPEQAEKVFDLFHRLDHKSDSDGEGLGLTIVRRIMDRQHGSVEIDSTPGRGTTVFVRLPAI